MSGYTKVGPFANDTSPAINAAFLNGVENYLVEGGGFGPNWLAANNAPAAVKTAVLNGGGVVCTGTNDHTDFNTALAAFKTVFLSEGTFNFGAPVAIPQGKSLVGSGLRATVINGASAMTGTEFFSIASEHSSIHDLTIDGGSATGKNGITANITSNAGFTTGSEGNTVLHNLLLRNVPGDGIRMEGAFNRDSKLYNIHIWNPSGLGVYVNCPDGSMHQIVVGTPGSHGFHFDTGAGNWRSSSLKAWFCDGDGIWFNGVRSVFNGIEAQDNELAGIRINGNLVTINGFNCDSNSWISGNGNANTHSGLEIGRTSAGGTGGGFDVSISGGMSWDKNESSRGRAQRSGVRCRTGVRRLTIVGVDTGDPFGTHFNVTAGIEFDTPSDLTHSSNAVYAIDHGARMTSGV